MKETTLELPDGRICRVFNAEVPESVCAEAKRLAASGDEQSLAILMDQWPGLEYEHGPAGDLAQYAPVDKLVLRRRGTTR